MPAHVTSPTGTKVRRFCYIDNIEAMLEQTSVLAQKGSAARPVPRSFFEVADALREVHASFETGGVFPTHVIDRTVAALGQM